MVSSLGDKTGERANAVYLRVKCVKGVRASPRLIPACLMTRVAMKLASNWNE